MPTRTAATRDDVSLLLADLLEATLCQRLEGRFLPITDEHGATPSGEPSIGGRWWIRECSATRAAGLLRLQLSGVGWVWVDEVKSGFRLRQYVLFRANSHLVGLSDGHYDPQVRVASVWFSPLATEADGHGIGLVSTSTDHLGADLLNVVTFGWAGSRADEAARREVDTRVRVTFEEKLRSGFTVTYQLPQQQLDFQLGRLGDGEEPRRPLLDGRPWLVNERQVLRPGPGAVHVIGPFAPAQGVEIDVRVETGPGLRYWAECAEITTQRMNSIEQEGALPPRPAAPKPSGQVGPGMTTTRIAMPACRWYLLTAASEEKTIASIRVRGRETTVLVPAP